jgi:hypothetical protein
MGKRFFTKKKEDAFAGWVVTIILAFIFLIGFRPSVYGVLIEDEKILLS